VKRTFSFIAFLSLLAICLTSCGSTDTLRTIDLTTPSTELQGIGGTIQLKATGNYAYGPARDLSDRVTYTVVVSPAPNNVDISGTPLPTPTTPPQTPQTIQIDRNGFITAVPPAVCTFADVGTATTAVWVLTGTYEITATFGKITSQPVFIGVASAAGPSAPPANGLCGPTSTTP
jgi:hypothetical protein